MPLLPEPALPVSPGFPAATRPPRHHSAWLIIGIAVALVLLGAGVQRAHPAHSTPGTLAIPGQLLGLRQNTNPAIQGAAARIARRTSTATHGRLIHVVAGYYGQPDRGFLVAGGGTCAFCYPKSAAQAITIVKEKGFADARSFPAGPKGGLMICFTLAKSGFRAPACAWSDRATSGTFVFVGGFALNLADAAAKTSQILTATEH